MLHPTSLANLVTFPDAALRWAFFSIAVATILLFIGLISLAIFLFRKQKLDRSFLYFALFVIPYAIRVFVRDPIFASVFAISPAVADHIIRIITVTITLPALFLFLDFVEARWRRVVLWTIAIQLLFAAVAIPLDYFGIARSAVDITNTTLVFVSWIILAVFLFVLRPPGRLSPELRVVAIGIVVFALFTVHANLVGLHLIPGTDVEPIGFLIFVSALGYLIAHRVIDREESLFALQKELQIAEQIQASILPREVPHLAGLEIAARYRPMSAVAGDFYDFLLPQNNQLGILVADVAGHGVPAALIASMLKVAFSVQAAHAQHPERVLTGLNHALCGKFDEHFVTAAYLFFDLEAKIVRYSAAGHPPLLFANRTSGSARCIEKNGLFLGMFPDAAYSALELPLNPGDRYVLYTDGLPESKNAREEEFSLARCLRFLESNSRLVPQSFADELLAEIARWSTSSSVRIQDDDMTLLVIDWDGGIISSASPTNPLSSRAERPGLFLRRNSARPAAQSKHLSASVGTTTPARARTSTCPPDGLNPRGPILETQRPSSPSYRWKLMVAIWLAALILGSVFAVAGAPGVARKLLNASIILGCMGLGLGIGYAAGLGGTNFGRAPHEAFPFAIIFGVVAAVACVALNRSRSDS